MFKVISNTPLLHTTVINTVTTLAQIQNGPHDHDFCFMGDFFSWSSLCHCHLHRVKPYSLTPFCKADHLALKSSRMPWSSPALLQTERAHYASFPGSHVRFLWPFVDHMGQFLPFRRLPETKCNTGSLNQECMLPSALHTLSLGWFGFFCGRFHGCWGFFFCFIFLLGFFIYLLRGLNCACSLLPFEY